MIKKKKDLVQLVPLSPWDLEVIDSISLVGPSVSLLFSLPIASSRFMCLFSISKKGQLSYLISHISQKLSSTLSSSFLITMSLFSPGPWTFIKPMDPDQSMCKTHVSVTSLSVTCLRGYAFFLSFFFYKKTHGFRLSRGEWHCTWNFTYKNRIRSLLILGQQQY